jgi:glycine cleavage system transcriptional repressor
VRHFAVTAVGGDRPGIVAAVSSVLLAHEGNVEDSQMTILRGHFTIMLIVSTSDAVDVEGLRSALERTGNQLGLDAVTLSEVSDGDPEAGSVPSHMVSVYGVDHPGIVHAVTSALAEHGVNITDLTTRLVGGADGDPLYAMMIEVVLPDEQSVEVVEQSLRTVREQQGVDLTIRPLEQDVL